MANATGVSHDAVQRIWAARGIKPHLVVKACELGDDPRFEEKPADAAGLHPSPPDKSRVGPEAGRAAGSRTTDHAR